MTHIISLYPYFVIRTGGECVNKFISFLQGFRRNKTNKKGPGYSRPLLIRQ
jgi:hypothetical protein